MSVTDVLSRLESVRETGADRWLAKCPAHDDRSPSLSIRQADDGTVLLHDFAGCSALEIVQSIGLELADLFPDSQVRRADLVRGAPRLSAADRLELVEHEITTAALILDKVSRRREVSDDQWHRIAQAAERIGRARHVR